VSTFVGLFLHGVTTLQSFYYFRTFTRDPLVLRISVALIWVFSTVHVVGFAAAIYNLTISNAEVVGEAVALLTVPPSFTISALFGTLVHFIAQCVYAWRVYKFSRSIYIPVICWTLSTYTLAVGLIISKLAYNVTFLQFGTLQTTWRWVGLSFFITTAICDIIIAAAMCYFLYQRRPKSTKLTGRTTRIIDHLMVWTVQSGLITSLMAVTCFIAYLADQTRDLWISFLLILTHLYSFTLVSLLNARITLSGTASGPSDNNETTIQFLSTHDRSRGVNRPNSPPLLHVRVIGEQAAIDHYNMAVIEEDNRTDKQTRGLVVDPL